MVYYNLIQYYAMPKTVKVASPLNYFKMQG